MKNSAHASQSQPNIPLNRIWAARVFLNPVLPHAGRKINVPQQASRKRAPG
jgi:hypothetical protein